MRIFLVGIVALLVGCAPMQVSMPVGVASIMYANARADYAAAKTLVTLACKQGKLSADECEAAKALDVKAQVYRETIEKALMNPDQPVDWQQVVAYSEQVVGLLLKLGLAP